MNGFLAALPLVIALGPVYGGRSFAWLVTRPVTPILVSLATSRLLLPWYASPGTRPLAVFVATACAAAVDAAVLVWVSRGAVFDRISIAGAGRAAPADRVQHGARARRLRRRRAIGGAEAPPYERRAPPYERKAWRPVP